MFVSIFFIISFIFFLRYTALAFFVCTFYSQGSLSIETNYCSIFLVCVVWVLKAWIMNCKTYIQQWHETKKKHVLNQQFYLFFFPRHYKLTENNLEDFNAIYVSLLRFGFTSILACFIVGSSLNFKQYFNN